MTKSNLTLTIPIKFSQDWSRGLKKLPKIAVVATARF